MWHIILPFKSTYLSVFDNPMTIDKSLKIKAADRWKEGDPVYGIPKVRVQTISLKKKKKVKKVEEDDSAAAGDADASAS